MSDQTTQPNEAEPTAPVDSPENGADQAQQEVDWQKRFEDTKAAYTQGQQELARLRQQQQDEEYQQQVAQEWLTRNGYALPDDEPEPEEFDDPNDALRHEVEELRQWRDQFESSTQQQQQLQALEEYSERKLTELGVPDDDPTRDWIVSRAIAMEPGADGRINLEGAFKELQELQNHMQRQWAKTKQAPRFSPNGQQGTQVPDLDDDQQRRQWMAEQYTARSAD